MENIISKELLDELGYGKVTHIGNINELYNMNCLNFTCEVQSISSRGDGKTITTSKTYNIALEVLAHKCKEWAFDNFYMVRTNYEHTIKGRLSRVSMSKTCEFNEHGNWFFSTCAETEPEAIFEACQWIYDEDIV